MPKVFVTFWDRSGDLWSGKLSAVPRVGEHILINNITILGRFIVEKVFWRVDTDQVSIRVSKSED